MRHIHPMDWSATALLRVALEKFSDEATTVPVYAKFFEKFVHTNGIRASKQAVPMVYQEILVLWSTSFSPSLTVDPSMLETAVRNVITNSDLLRQKRTSTTVSGARAPKQDRTDIFCEDWNKPASCSNTAAQGGCVNQAGKFMKHSCTKRIGNKYCGSNKHGQHNH